MSRGEAKTSKTSKFGNSLSTLALGQLGISMSSIGPSLCLAVELVPEKLVSFRCSWLRMLYCHSSSSSAITRTGPAFETTQLTLKLPFLESVVQHSGFVRGLLLVAAHAGLPQQQQRDHHAKDVKL